MGTEKFALLSLCFYSIQMAVRIFFLTSLSTLKKSTMGNTAFFYLSIILASLAFTYLLSFNSILKFISDVILVLAMFHYFCEGKFSTKVLYYMISTNVLLVVECIVSGITIMFFKVDFTTLTSTSVISLYLTIATILICVLHVFLLKILKRRQEEIEVKYTLSIIFLTITQSLLVIVQVCSLAFDMLLSIYPLLAICIILSYFLVKYISAYIYQEYRYKENTIYFIKQYEVQLNDYLKLKDTETEIQYLRHEIMNQLKAYQSKQEPK